MERRFDQNAGRSRPRRRRSGCSHPLCGSADSFAACRAHWRFAGSAPDKRRRPKIEWRQEAATASALASAHDASRFRELSPLFTARAEKAAPQPFEREWRATSSSALTHRAFSCAGQNKRENSRPRTFNSVRLCASMCGSRLGNRRHCTIPAYSQRSRASRKAAPAAVASVVAAMMTVLSGGRSRKYSGLSRLCGRSEILPSDRSTRHQSMFL